MYLFLLVSQYAMDYDEPIGFTDEELRDLSNDNTRDKGHVRNGTRETLGGSKRNTRSVTSTSQPSIKQNMKRTEYPLGFYFSSLLLLNKLV